MEKFSNLNADPMAAEVTDLPLVPTHRRMYQSQESSYRWFSVLWARGPWPFCGKVADSVPKSGKSGKACQGVSKARHMQSANACMDPC